MDINCLAFCEKVKTPVVQALTYRLCLFTLLGALEQPCDIRGFLQTVLARDAIEMATRLIFETDQAIQSLTGVVKGIAIQGHDDPGGVSVVHVNGSGTSKR